jgi:hypothetical protein
MMVNNEALKSKHLNEKGDAMKTSRDSRYCAS